MLQNVKNAPKLKRLVGNRAFYARVIGIVVPLIVQNTVTNVVSLLDNVMVGRVGTLQMSAVAIVNQLLFVFNLCIFGGLAGAGIFATQFAGAEDHEGVRHCLRMKWIIAMVMLVVAHIMFALIPEKLISMYLAEHTLPQDAANTLAYGMDYLGVMLWGLVPFAITQIYASTLREVGETRLPMIASVVAILVNLVFNYLLIFGTFGFPRLGVVGARHCHGALPLCGNGDHRRLYACHACALPLHQRSVPQPAHPACAASGHCLARFAAAGQ